MQVHNDPAADIEKLELKRLLQAAQQGDAAAMQGLRERLEDPSLWRSLADLSGQVEGSLIETVAGQNLPLAEGLKEKLKSLREELGHEGASGVERLLIERVVLGWLEVQYLDALATQRGVSATPEGKELDRRRSTAQRRYLGALKQLPAVQKLLGRASVAAGKGSSTKRKKTA